MGTSKDDDSLERNEDGSDEGSEEAEESEEGSEEGEESGSGEEESEEEVSDVDPDEDRLVEREDDEEGGNAMPIEYLAEDEPVEEEEKPRERSGIIFAVIFCCCCLILIAVAATLAVLLVNKSNDDGSDKPKKEILPTGVPTREPIPLRTNPPKVPTTSPPTIKRSPAPTGTPTVTPRPSVAPVIPPTAAPTETTTMSPTITAAPTPVVPPGLIIPPTFDTYVYLNGYFEGEAFGTEDTFLVQNGPSVENFEDEQIPDAVGLLTFDISKIPTGRLDGRNRTAQLYLNHVVTALEREPRIYGIDRIPSSRLDVETFHGDLWEPPSEDVVYGPNFTVAVTDTQVVVDITDLVFGQPPFTEGRRKLQDFNALDQLFIMITDKTEEPTDVGGDRFYTREGGSTTPFLNINMLLPGETAPPIVIPTGNSTTDEGTKAPDEGTAVPDEGTAVPDEMTNSTA